MKLALKMVTLLGIVAYVLVCGYMGVNQRSFLYFPQPVADRVVQDSQITRIHFKHNDIILSGYTLNEGQDKALLFYGGNASAIGYYIDFFKQFSQYTVYMLPYRGFGDSQGIPSEAALYSDALFIYDQISDTHRSVSAVGRSLGSGVATYVAANRPLEKLVLVTPYDSITEVAKEKYWMLPVDWLIQDRFDSYSRATQITARTLVVIAGQDQVIKRARTARLLSVLKGDHVRSVVLEDIGHSKIFNQPSVAEVMGPFLASDHP